MAKIRLRYRVLDTRHGSVAFVASSRGLRRVYLPVREAAGLGTVIHRDFPTAVGDGKLMPKLARALRRYFTGQTVEFSVPIDWTGWGDFEVAVWRACRRIRYGRTRAYGELAAQVGHPGGARAVGRAMSRNPCPIVVPCHRVVRSDGSLGGFSAPGGPAVKQRLLRMEAAWQGVQKSQKAAIR